MTVWCREGGSPQKQAILDCLRGFSWARHAGVPGNVPKCMHYLGGMMTIMRRKSPDTRAAAKDASHERIVSAAARAIRRSGYAGTGVADIMKEAGLTHGAFYAHFDSRDSMLTAAADQAGAESLARAHAVVSAAPAKRSLEFLIHSYLSQDHLKDIECGCPMAALGSEMPRQSPEVRRVATSRIKEMIDLVAREVQTAEPAEARKKSLVIVATMVGTLILARAVNDPALSEELCSAALRSLTITST